MVSTQIEYVKLFLTIVGSLTTTIAVYHKFIMNQIEKKVDQKLYDKEIGYTQSQIKYNYINLDNKIQVVSDNLNILMDHTINKNK